MHKAEQFKQSSHLREAVIQNVKQILGRNTDIKMKEIMVVGVMESGKLEFKTPTSIRNRQIILLLGYLKWFWNIKEEDLE